MSKHRPVPAIRILPMSDKAKGFVGLSIDEVQAKYFLRKLPRRGGRYRYAKTGLLAEPGTVVLFQYRAHVIASAVFLRDEKFTNLVDGHGGRCGGVLHFEADSFRTFEPLNAETMRKVWPWFIGFGHSKQSLNPALHSAFTRRLKSMRAPSKQLPTNANE